MNNGAVLALWEDDGIALLPNTPPIRGKSNIAVMLREVRSAHPSAKMDSFTMRCSDAQGAGNFVSEWCTEHQIVSESGKPMFDGWGKMLLVLHRQPSGKWLLSREMWNQAQPPDND